MVLNFQLHLILAEGLNYFEGMNFNIKAESSFDLPTEPEHFIIIIIMSHQEPMATRTILLHSVQSKT